MKIHSASITIVAIISVASSAKADLKVCNDTTNTTGVAIGYNKNQTEWVSEGWWEIPPDICAAVIKGELTARYYYIHAEESNTGGQWRGDVVMCTSNKQFEIKGKDKCFQRGFEQAGFFEIDTQNEKNWQVRLSADNQTGGQ